MEFQSTWLNKFMHNDFCIVIFLECQRFYTSQLFCLVSELARKLSNCSNTSEDTNTTAETQPYAKGVHMNNRYLPSLRVHWDQNASNVWSHSMLVLTINYDSCSMPRSHISFEPKTLNNAHHAFLIKLS